MKQRWMAVGVVALVVGLLAGTALVQEGQRPPREGRDREGRGDRGGMAMRGRGAGGMLPDYTAGIRDLTQEQRRQIAQIRRDTMDKIRVLEKQMNDEVKRVLTPDQVKAMEAAQRRVTHRGPDGVTLTDEQKQIMDKAWAAAAEAEGREERAEIIREAIEKVRASYSEEQKEQAEENRARFQRMRGGGRRGGAGGGQGGEGAEQE